MKSIPYWHDSAPAFTAGAAGPVPARADVVVIGAGFTGLAAALTLAKTGARVVVVEAGRVAGEASGRNGGHCNNGLAHDFTGLAARLGSEPTRALYRAFDDAVTTVERLIADEAIDCDFVRSGKLKLAAKPGHYAGLARAAEVLAREVDPAVRLIAPADLAGEIGSPVFHGGLLHPASASMHMGKFSQGLAMAAVRAGGALYEQALVTAIEPLGGRRQRVTTARGVIEAGQVLIATGASRRGPLGWFRRRIVPVGSFIVVTEPLGAARAARIMPGRRNCTTSLNIGHYFRLTADHRLIFGGRARFALSGPQSDRKSGRILEAGLARTFPDLGPVRLDYCWGGLVDMTRDRLPRAGEHQGCFYALGYSGHGTQMSVHLGTLIGRLIAGQAAANPFAGLDWPPVPGHFGPPWFLPFVGLYYRLMDLLH